MSGGLNHDMEKGLVLAPNRSKSPGSRKDVSRESLEIDGLISQALDGFHETSPTAQATSPPAARNLAPTRNSSSAFPEEDASQPLGDSPPSQLPPQQLPTQQIFARRPPENDQADAASSKSDWITKLPKLQGEILQNYRSLDFYTRLQTLYDSTVVSANSSRITINLASLLRMELMVLRRGLTRHALRLRYMNFQASEGVQDPESLFMGNLPTMLYAYTTALQRWDSVKKQALKGRSKDPYILTTDRTEDLDLIKELITEFRDIAEQEVSINKRPREVQVEERPLSMSGELSRTNGEVDAGGKGNASRHRNGTGSDGGRDHENNSVPACRPPSDRTVIVKTRPFPDGQENVSHHGNEAGPDGGHDNETHSIPARRLPSDGIVASSTRPLSDGDENVSHYGNDGTGLDSGRENENENENHSIISRSAPSERIPIIRSRPGSASALPSSFKSNYLLDKIYRDLKMLMKLPERADQDIDTGLFELFGGSRNMLNKKEAFAAFMQRLGMAIAGGVFLVVPMLIMVLQKGLLTSLLTISLFVFAFGLTLSFCLSDAFNVLSGTAAYAAVLVVFVGTNNS